MDESEEPSDPLAVTGYPSDRGPDRIVEHPLALMDPRGLDLPGQNWGFCQLYERSLVIYEVTVMLDSSTLRIRKHIHVDLSSGVCTSYILDRKISEMTAASAVDVEHCVEELHMMSVCGGGPAVSRFLPEVGATARVDAYGKWRHNSCRVIVAWTGLPCNACESLANELEEIERANERRERKDDAPRTVAIANASHRKQSQIILLGKQRHNWYRKMRDAEKEMKLIDELIAEVSEMPEPVEDDDEDDDEDDNEL